MKSNDDHQIDLPQSKYEPLDHVLPPLALTDTDDAALATCYRIAKERARQRRATKVPPALPSIHTPEESPHDKNYHQFSTCP